jgi:hypothetical protein
MQAEMWRTIDGETVMVLLEQVADMLSQATRIIHEGVELIVVDYETWKAKVYHCQVHDTSDESE